MEYTEYHAEIAALAEELEARLISLVVEHEGDVARAQGDLDEELWEVIDGHAYLIYSHHAMEVCRLSDNDNALFDEIGGDSLDTSRGFGHICTQIAFYAMRADVQDCIRDWDSLRDAYLDHAIEVAVDSGRGQYIGDFLAEYLDPALAAEIAAARREDREDLGDLLAAAYDLPRVMTCDGEVYIVRDGIDPAAVACIMGA